jgi:hypothetical protein
VQQLAGRDGFGAGLVTRTATVRPGRHALTHPGRETATTAY